jgi:hypothetical protein
MKATHKNLTNGDCATKSVHDSLERVRSFLRLNRTLNYPAEGFKSSITWYRENKENEALRTEVEMKRNQARIYASVVPPK